MKDTPKVILANQEIIEINNEISKDKLEEIYILYADIVGFSKNSNSTMYQHINLFNKVVMGEIKHRFNKKDVIINYLPTGDGCLIIFRFKNRQIGSFHRYDRSFEVLLYGIALQEQIKSKEFGIRTGITIGQGKLLQDLNSLVNLIGSDINACQRIMDFGSENHILLSRKFFDSLSQAYLESDYEWHIIIDDLDIAISYVNKEFYDKHNKKHEIYNVRANRNREILTNPNLPKIRRMKIGLNENDLDFFIKLMDKCDSFFSVSLEEPEEWFNDETLLSILFAQSYYANSNKTFKRIFIWNDLKNIEINNTSYFRILGRLSSITHIELKVIDFDKALEIIKSNSKFQEISETLNHSKFYHRYDDLICNPLREMWISYTKNRDGIESIGVGSGIIGGTYSTIQINDEDAKDFIKNIFNQLDQNSKSICEIAR